MEEQIIFTNITRIVNSTTNGKTMSLFVLDTTDKTHVINFDIQVLEPLLDAINKHVDILTEYHGNN
jgi:hypothetical protein